MFDLEKVHYPMMFRRLYAVQGGYMLFRMVISMFMFMLKKIMMLVMATNVIASRPPKRQPTGTPSARANLSRPTLIQDTERSSVSASEDRLKGVS